MEFMFVCFGVSSLIASLALLFMVVTRPRPERQRPMKRSASERQLEFSHAPQVLADTTARKIDGALNEYMSFTPAKTTRRPTP